MQASQKQKAGSSVPQGCTGTAEQPRSSACLTCVPRCVSQQGRVLLGHGWVPPAPRPPPALGAVTQTFLPAPMPPARANLCRSRAGNMCQPQRVPRAKDRQEAGQAGHCTGRQTDRMELEMGDRQTGWSWAWGTDRQDGAGHGGTDRALPGGTDGQDGAEDGG